MTTFQGRKRMPVETLGHSGHDQSVLKLEVRTEEPFIMKQSYGTFGKNDTVFGFSLRILGVRLVS